MGEGQYEEDDYEAPAPKRKSISNAETVQMMMMAEAQRERISKQPIFRCFKRFSKPR